MQIFFVPSLRSPRLTRCACRRRWCIRRPILRLAISLRQSSIVPLLSPCVLIAISTAPSLHDNTSAHTGCWAHAPGVIQIGPAARGWVGDACDLGRFCAELFSGVLWRAVFRFTSHHCTALHCTALHCTALPLRLAGAGGGTGEPLSSTHCMPGLSNPAGHDGAGRHPLACSVFPHELRSFLRRHGPTRANQLPTITDFSSHLR